jgi:hypothetical protein
MRADSALKIKLTQSWVVIGMCKRAEHENLNLTTKHTKNMKEIFAQKRKVRKE